MQGKGWPRLVLLGAVVVVAVAALLLWLAPRPVEVDTALATRGPISEAVFDQGTARVREAYLVSAPVSGEVERLTLEVGHLVRAGSVIARIAPSHAGLLDPRTQAQAQAAAGAASSNLAAAVAQAAQADVEAVRAAAEHARLARLAASGIVSRQALETGLARDRTAQAAVAAARAMIGLRRAELVSARAMLGSPEAGGAAQVLVRAPSAGLVTRVLHESAGAIDAGTALVEISDEGEIEAVIEFLTQDAVRIRAGMPAEIYDWGDPHILPARVRRVEPQGFTRVSALGVEEQRVLVRLQFTGDPATRSQLAPGYRLWGRVVLRREPQALRVPLGALVRAEGRWATFRLSEGRARLTPIQVGAMSSDLVEVRDGLNADDRVVVYPSDQVRDGVALRQRARSTR